LLDRSAPSVEGMTKTNTVLRMLLAQRPPFVPEGAEGMTVLIELPPGDPGSPPHRHSGPVFGYLLEGEMIFELEGEPERVIRAGEAFWEPGGDVIHYQAANSLSDRCTRFVVVMLCAPGQEMLVYVDDEELEQRRDRRAPRPR
jgi:quercetin dioxygenase-like cupin family protein